MVVVVLYVHCASVYKLGLVKDTLEASTLLTGGGVVCASVYKQHSIVQKDAVVFGSMAIIVEEEGYGVL